MKILGKLSICACLAIAALNAENNATNSKASFVPNSQKTDGGGDTQKDEFKPIIVTAKSPEEVYQSGYKIDQNMLKNISGGNGDIGTAIRVLPNIQFSNNQNASTNPGEINPADISISGGLYNQNRFIFNGFDMNNDLNPNGVKIFGSSNHNQWGSNQAQGFAVDTSLIDNIEVYDSNIGAKYGGFNGGIVIANAKKPDKDGWHGSLSYQRTQDSWTKYHIDDSVIDAFQNSSTEYYQPEFTKEIYRSNLGGWFNDYYGVMLGFSSTRAKIPLYAYSETYQTQYGAVEKKKQKRQIDNFYLNNFINIGDNLELEASISYSPNKQRMFRPNVRGSEFDLVSGGWQYGLKADWHTDLGLIQQKVSYTTMKSSRDSQDNFWRSWYYSPGKDWVKGAASVTEGGFGDMNQESKTFKYEFDFKFKPVELANTTHKFATGFDFSYTKMIRERVNGYYVVLGGIKNLNGQGCKNDYFMGFETCIDNGIATYRGETYDGQYYDYIRGHRPGKNSYSMKAYGVYVEDDVEIDLAGNGKLDIRPGIRFEGDDYMDNKTFSPRFSATYTAPWEEQYHTAITIGANRYYNRNLLSYRLFNAENAYQSLGYYYRDDAQTPWYEDMSQRGNGITDSIFRKLDLPYANEYSIAMNQRIGIIDTTLKYIHRDYEDQIYRTRAINMPNFQGFDPNQNTTKRLDSLWDYANDGKAKSDVISLMAYNVEPLEIYGVKNHFLLGFDWTQTKRNYRDTYSTSDLNANFNFPDKEIIYNGEIIKFKDKPDKNENYARPYTIRLNTTHNFNIGQTVWTLNNFFRYRSSYKQDVKISYEGKRYWYPNANDPNRVIKTDEYDEFATIKFPSAFTWDIRLGTEIKLRKNEAFFVNLDIFNVLNTKNKATISTTSGDADPEIAESGYNGQEDFVGVYETGRQFWLQLGYKF